MPGYVDLRASITGVEGCANAQQEYRQQLKQNQDQITAAVARRPSLVDRHDQVGIETCDHIVVPVLQSYSLPLHRLRHSSTIPHKIPIKTPLNQYH